ncbi:hypothetical protein SHO565_32320 [Streptomyces sp. HO565]
MFLGNRRDKGKEWYGQVSATIGKRKEDLPYAGGSETRSVARPGLWAEHQ